ncbi:MAG TPA: carboxypeptidase regulatory-like domain-containing protein [Vicinamibacterales bacterium]|nr:carboxypeptidase regulatory-like domain-containing protein [Vicinamibacterales bacterium]
MSRSVVLRAIGCLALTLVWSTLAIAQASHAVTGVIVDATGAVLPSVRVDLADAAGETRTTATDGRGAFAFDAIAPGRYTIRAALDGFRTQTVAVVVGAGVPRPLRIMLPLANVQQAVTVTGGAPQVGTGAAANADAITVNQSVLESLPVFDDDPVAMLSHFLDIGSLASGGVTILVNGMEVNSLTVSSSAIQQIRINQDPYSASYSRPGRGRIDIITKPGSQEYHGSGNMVFRDSSLNARNAFATVRPPEQRRIGDGFLGGPVGSGGNTSFMFSVKADSEARQAIVFALGPQGDIHDAVAQPYRHVLASFGLTHQHGASTISIRPSYEEESDTRGAGGTTLGSAATTYYHRESDLTYNQQTVLSSSLLNQFQILVGQELEPTTSVSAAPGIVVNGAFTGGGAQIDLRRTEAHFQLSENLALTRGAHFLQAGFQVPDWSRRGFYDRSGFGGTYYFSDLPAYTAGRPYAFVQQGGNGDVVWLEKVLGLYANDDWRIGPRATLSFGVRYDWSNYFADHDNLAPRFSLAVKPTGGDATVLRGGAGLFYDKVGPFPVITVLNFRPGGLQQIVLTNPSYPDPFAAGSGAAAAPPSTAQFAPGIQVPWTLQYSGGVERQLGKSATLSLMYYGSEGRLFRSRDLNAPAPPLYAARPNPAFGVVRQVDGSARRHADSMQVTLRGRFGRVFNGQVQYALSKTMDDSGGLNWYPANDDDPSAEWARADFDRRHNLVLLGSVTPGRQFSAGIGVRAGSGLPYSELLGTDLFNNGRGNARPAGVARNTLQGAGYTELDLRLSRDFAVGRTGAGARTLSIGVDAFNVLNAVNYSSYVGTITSPRFGQPVAAQAPRELQLSARVTF